MRPSRLVSAVGLMSGADGKAMLTAAVLLGSGVGLVIGVSCLQHEHTVERLSRLRGA